MIRFSLQSHHLRQTTSWANLDCKQEGKGKLKIMSHGVN